MLATMSATVSSPLASSPSLSAWVPDNARRFGGTARLYGTPGARRIAAAHVAVVGIGGVGSWAAEALARTGIGSITLIDMDHVAESNLNRQIHATGDTLGMAKVEAMRQRIASYHPGCCVQTVDAFVEPGNWPDILPAGVDAVIDACDQMAAKQAMAAWALRQRTLFMAAGAAGGKQMAHLVDIADLSQVTHDPLLAKLRYALRRQHGAARDGRKIGIACVFSREAVQQPQQEACDAGGNDGSLNCHGYGSAVSVTATFGMAAAGWVLQKIAAGVEKPGN